MRPVLIAFVMLVSPVLAAGDFKAFLSEHCMDCHDDATKKGDLSLESLGMVVTTKNSRDWLKVLEQVERHSMPPADKAQPKPEDRHAAVLDLENRLVAHAKTLPQNKQAVLRRLNRNEYRNTIRDLLELELGSDPTADFPGDVRSHGFASNGEKLVTSGFLLRQYVEAADAIISQAVHFETKPEVQRWAMKPPFDRTSGAEMQQAAAYFKKTKEPQPYQDICQRIGAGGAPYSQYHLLDDVSDAGAPVAGWYRVRMEVEAKFRHSFQDQYFTRWKPLWDGTEPIRLSLFTATLQGIDPANKEARDFAATHEQAGQKHIATWDLPDEKKLWIEATLWLERGQFPRLGFPNGPTNSNYRLNSYFNEQAKATLSADKFAEYEARAKQHGGWISFQFGESPRVRLHRIEMEGPLNETWPPQSHRLLVGDGRYDSANAAKVLQAFASRAWRRPATAAQVAPLVKLVQTAEKSGLSAELAIQEGLKAVLCSPEFLYREEKAEVLTGHELASRLSYFLWASMPDEALLRLASTGELAKPDVIKREAIRMLEDSRGNAFVDEFLDGWLRLDKLGTMAPDVHRFAVYYDDQLESAMRRETRLFFRQLLNTNGSVNRLLDSSDSFINTKLARLYGIDPKLVTEAQSHAVAGLKSDDLVPDGAGHAPSLGFAQVKLPDSRRGGLLGQASVLTLTANGVDTSPVIRGVWLLENILGATPSPPPPNVPSIEPDIRGAKTIRDQLMKHQENGSCRTCHRQIDPPGFALENFDAIGRWRGHYVADKVALPIDASGQFGATKFKEVSGFKKELLARREQFVRCLVEKLLLHALGRELSVTDRPYIRQIIETAAKDDYRLRDLVVLCVTSEIFRRK